MDSRHQVKDHARAQRPILVVEQDLALRDRLDEAFRRHGFSVITVQSGERAITVLKHTQAGAILADVRLADTTGWDLADRVRAFDAQLPIILLDASPQGPHESPGAHEVQAILSTDTAPDTLVEEVERWLDADEPSRTERWPGTVLVVDDEPRLRDILREALESRGFTVATAASGEDAVEQVRRLAPSVVLLDVKMPGKLEGLATLKQIKVMKPDVTVFMITGVEEKATMEEAIALGAYDYILKPLNLDYLRTVLLSKILLGDTP